MTEANIQSLSDIKGFIEENNTMLKAAIQALEILSNQTLQQPDQMVQQPVQQPPPLPARNYPGYTTPPHFGFMQ